MGYRILTEEPQTESRSNNHNNYDQASFKETFRRTQGPLGGSPAPPVKSPPAKPFRVSWSLVALLAVFYLLGRIGTFPHPSTSPSPSSRASSPVLVEWPAPRAQLVALPPRLLLPDGRPVAVRYRGEVALESLLPRSGNRLGDTYLVGDRSFWIWTYPIGSAVPAWIDP